MHFLIRHRPPRDGLVPQLPYEIWDLEWGGEPPVRKSDIADVRDFFASLRAPGDEIETALSHLVERKTAQLTF